MRISLRKTQVQAILSLSDKERYYLCIKQIAGWNELYSIYDDDWVLLGDDPGARYFPIWPAREYAELYNTQNDKAYTIKLVKLDEFMDKFLDNFKADQISLGVFLTPENKGVILPVNDFKDDML